MRTYSPVGYVGGDLADSVLDLAHTIVDVAVRRALSRARAQVPCSVSDDMYGGIVAYVWDGMRADLIDEFSAGKDG